MKKEILEKVLNSPKNLIVEGDIQSGKTANVLFPIVDDIIEKQESFLVLDAKEEYIHQYSQKLKDKNYQVITINLRDMNKSDGWNPLAYPYFLYQNGEKDKAQEYLEQIGKVIFSESHEQDPFWSQCSTDLFVGTTLGLFEDGREAEIHFNSVYHMFEGLDKKLAAKDYLTAYFDLKGKTSKPYIFASTTILAPKDTKGSILSVARQKLRRYVSLDSFSSLMNKNTFDYESILNQPTAIIFITRDENTEFNGFATMFIEQFYSILVGRHLNNQFHFVMDYFDTIDYCPDLVDMLSSCRARNVRVYLATRSLKRLNDLYGDYLFKLCDLISIGSRDLRIVLQDMEQIIEKEFERVEVTPSAVQYPTLVQANIQLFDIENAVHSNKKASLLKETTFKSFEVDDYIHKIDEKIAELEEETNMNNQELANKYLAEIKDEVDQEMIRRGLMQYVDGKEIVADGSCHVRWAIEKAILKERYHFDWKTPAEENPNIQYD